MKSNKSTNTLLLSFIISISIGIPWQQIYTKLPLNIFSGCEAQKEIPLAECEALVALYNNTTGSGWINKTDWLQTDTLCNWYGVYCSNGSIKYLYLNYNNLIGYIPPQLKNLNNLQYLFLSGNQLAGSIPEELGSLSKLRYLHLESNQLSGEIPDSITNLKHLISIQFDSCGALTTSDLNVIDFLDAVAPSGWSDCPKTFVAEGKLHWIKNGSPFVYGYNGTDFGNVIINSPHFNDYQIRNQVNEVLFLTGNPKVEIMGSPAFSVSALPNPTIYGGYSTYFRILFNPQFAGTHTAIVSIENSSLNKNPYTFTIQGFAIWDDTYEKDNDFSTAKIITPGSLQTHSLYPASYDKDFLKFTISTPSKVTLETTGLWGYDTEVALYDESYNLIGYDNDGGEFLYSKLNTTCVSPLTSGTYYALVYNYEGIVPQYQLQLNIEDCPPIVNSITRVSASPTNSNSVDFKVIFSEVIQNVDVGDFILTTSGITGASITSVTGSDSIYTVSVNTGTGSGTLRLDIPTSASISDLNNNSLIGLPFETGEAYTILPAKPVAAPKLSLPKQNSVSNTPMPSFSWTDVTNAALYEIVVASNAAFSQGVFTANTNSPIYTPTIPLTDGKYFWRVRALNRDGQPGKYSSTQVFTIDITSPLPPILTSPLDTTTLRSSPVFRWNKSSSAVLYEFQYDNDADFSSPSYSGTTRNNNVKPPAMPNGAFFWRVRAQDAAGNWSNWSLVRSIMINR